MFEFNTLAFVLNSVLVNEIQEIQSIEKEENKSTREK